MQKQSALLVALTGERNHRFIAALLVVVVLLLHLWVVVILLHPTESDKKLAVPKVMEVALISEVHPKEESPPPKPAPAKPTPTKKVQPPPPRKKDVKPPVKKKTPIIHKIGDIAQPKEISKEPVREPFVAPPAPQTPVQKPVVSVAPAAKKPLAKAGAGDNPNKGGNSGVVALSKPAPTYPMRAVSRRIEGWVKVEFTVSTSGSVSNPVVVGASPPGIFDEAALNNIRQWRFKPKLVNGSPVAQRATQTIRFKLLK